MAKYTIWAKQTSYLFVEVEADSFEEAAEMYEDIDGGDFTEEISTADWELAYIEDENGNDYMKL